MTHRYDLLSDALGITRGQLVAFVGGGGKTSAVLTVARELRVRGWRVVASTTTKVGGRLESEMPVVLAADGRPLEALGDVVDESGLAFLAGVRGPDGKLHGAEAALVASVLETGLADVVLVEADGARQRPLKVPERHEPIIPESTHLVAPFAGMDALGATIGPESVHRPELVRRYAGEERTVTPGLVADILCDGDGGLKGVPAEAAAVPVLNKVDAATRLNAEDIARTILAKRPDRITRVLLTNLFERDYRAIEL